MSSSYSGIGLTVPFDYHTHKFIFQVVRRAAVLACARLYASDRDLVLEGGIVDSLYAMIRDPDPIVLVNVLCTLEEHWPGKEEWSSIIILLSTSLIDFT